jgi:outer membrane protein OmpA-like peptidoglycan-associated protein
MITNKKKFNHVVAGVLSCVLLAFGSSHAADGYLVDSDGDVVRSSSGDCWHTGTFAPENATIVGCDGVTLTPQVMVIEGEATGLVSTTVVPAATLFAFDSAKLTDEGKSALEEYLAAYDVELRPELAKAYAGLIIGYTDSTGNPDYNLDLSLRRAQAVRDYLVETGVSPDKLRVIGRGEADPIAPNTTAEGRAQNRRVEIVVIGEVKALDAVVFPSAALFERRQGRLSPSGERELAKNLQDAREMLTRAAYIEIVGHTDNVGDDAYNQELSEERAIAVRDYLVGRGVDVNKIYAWGAGEKLPVASNATAEGRAQNRRVEVLVLGRLR